MVLVKFIIVSLAMCNYTLCMNLDVNHAIIYKDAHSYTENIYNATTLFGYATLLYPATNHSKAGIIIGAPRGSSATIPFEQPGVVFKCEIKELCRMISLDSDHGNGTQGKEVYSDSKYHAFIGGSMDIHVATGNLVICGFHWQNNTNLLGVCYLSSDVTASGDQFEKRMPLLIKRAVSKLNSRGNRVYQYGMGQAGFSVHLTPEKTPKLFLGAPGLNQHKGGAILVDTANRRQTVALGIIKQKDALMGYAGTSGRYTNAGELLYASSLPFATFTKGRVAIYRLPKDNTTITPLFALEGSQVGEYFGAALATGDLNGDGFDDLIVGAPFYAAPKNGWNDGRAWVYFGGQVMGDDNRQLLTATGNGNGHGAQFGMALSCVGDLNGDGFKDLAIGAPYSEDGRGRVYIYHGYMQGLRERPAQVLIAAEIDHALRGFGISISNGVDVDRNGFLDIAIGAHVSGHAVVVRSFPVIRMLPKWSIVNGNQLNIGNITLIELCHNYTFAKFVSTNVRVHRLLKIDSRMEVITKNMLDRKFFLQTICESFMIINKENITDYQRPVKMSVSYELIDDHSPDRNPIHIGDANANDTFRANYPILDDRQPHVVTYSFALGCGVDNTCMSHLSFAATFPQLNDSVFVVGSKDTLAMDVDVINSGDFAYLAQLHIELPKYYVQFGAFGKCRQRSATTISCLLGNPLKTNITQSLEFLMEHVRAKLTPQLEFGVRVTTSSNNSNADNFFQQYVVRVEEHVDLQISTESERIIYPKNTAVGFSQIYKIRNVGVSTADNVRVAMQIPTFIMRAGEKLEIITIASSKVWMDDQIIDCTNTNTNEHDDDEDEAETNNEQRSKRSADPDIDPEASDEDDTTEDGLYSTTTPVPGNETQAELFFGLDCGKREDLQCTTVTCDVKTLRPHVDIAVVHELLLHVQLLDPDVGVIVVKGNGRVSNEYERFDNDNTVEIETRFTIVPDAEDLFWFLLIGSACVGTLLLLIVTLILYCCGFFVRKTKLLLEEEKQEVDALDEFEHLRSNPDCDCMVFPESKSFENLENDIYDSTEPN